MLKRSDEDRARRGFANAANNTFGVLKPETLAVEGGWRDARMLDGEFMGWLCPHVHATKQAAEGCPERESVLGPPSDPQEDPSRW